MRRYVFGLLLLVTFPLLATASSHHQHSNRGNHQAPLPSPVATTPVATSSIPYSPSGQNGQCINYGYQPLINGQYDLIAASKDLAALKAAGITCVRIGFYGTNSSVTKPLALLAKQMGFYVVIGNDGTPTASGYASGVIAEATWAQANHIDQVSIGNEDAKNVQTQSALSVLSCQVRQIYSGVISYDTYLATSGFNDISAWAANKGCLDKLGLNNYGGYTWNKATIQEAVNALGASHVYVSETDCDVSNASTGCTNDATRAAEVQGDYLQLLKDFPGMQMYFFAYDSSGDGVPTYWGLQSAPLTAKSLGI